MTELKKANQKTVHECSTVLGVPIRKILVKIAADEAAREQSRREIEQVIAEAASAYGMEHALERALVSGSDKAWELARYFEGRAGEVRGSCERDQSLRGEFVDAAKFWQIVSNLKEEDR